MFFHDEFVIPQLEHQMNTNRCNFCKRVTKTDNQIIPVENKKGQIKDMCKVCAYICRTGMEMSKIEKDESTINLERYYERTKQKSIETANKRRIQFIGSIQTRTSV